MDFYRTPISSMHARIANGQKAIFPQNGSLIPTTRRICCKTPILSDNLARVLENILSLFCTLHCLFPRRNNSPSTAAAPPPAAAITPVCCAKIAFFHFSPQLSSPSISDFSPFRFPTKGSACGMSEAKSLGVGDQNMESRRRPRRPGMNLHFSATLSLWDALLSLFLLCTLYFAL
jgi:hypothetical protein